MGLHRVGATWNYKSRFTTSPPPLDGGFPGIFSVLIVAKPHRRIASQGFFQSELKNIQGKASIQCLGGGKCGKSGFVVPRGAPTGWRLSNEYWSVLIVAKPHRRIASRGFLQSQSKN